MNSTSLPIPTLVIEDSSCAQSSSSAGGYSDIQSSFSQSETAAAALSKFLEAMRTKFGLGLAAGLLVDFINGDDDGNGDGTKGGNGDGDGEGDANGYGDD